MPETVQATRELLETRLIEKAWKDPEFKRRVTSDPKGTFEEHFGSKLPDNLKIFVHEEDAHTLHFSIPPAPTNIAELGDDELERIHGGEVIIMATVALAAVIASGAVGTIVGSIASAAAKGTSSPW